MAARDTVQARWQATPQFLVDASAECVIAMARPDASPQQAVDWRQRLAVARVRLERMLEEAELDAARVMARLPAGEGVPGPEFLEAQGVAWFLEGPKAAAQRALASADAALRVVQARKARGSTG